MLVTMPTPQELHPDLAAVLASPQQHTLKTGFTVTGVGLHTGCDVQVSILPAPAHQGRFFRRQFQGKSLLIPARVNQVRHTLLSTELWHTESSPSGSPEYSGDSEHSGDSGDSRLGVEQGVEAGVQTVEHLLSALIGLGIDNAEIVIDGGEVPLLEGSAQGWATQVMQVGWKCLDAARPQLRLRQPVIVGQGESYAMALPVTDATLRLSYGIDFPVPVIGQQWFSFDFPDFATAISPCRTFGSLAQIEQMRSSGLIKGGSLENALVCSQTEWLNPPLYFDNEPVRHKLLDFLGDLSLLGYIPRAHYLAYKGSHALHIALAQAMLAEHAIVTA
jgi:UDP-3-O-[3-hydroxymyristoyl] N-acetylglucosamine deacetylase